MARPGGNAPLRVLRTAARGCGRTGTADCRGPALPAVGTERRGGEFIACSDGWFNSPDYSGPGVCAHGAAQRPAGFDCGSASRAAASLREVACGNAAKAAGLARRHARDSLQSLDAILVILNF